MRKNVYAILFLLLVLTYEIVLGKEANKTKNHKTNKKNNSTKEKHNIERIKRSLDDEEEKPFWANRGKKKITSANHNKNDIAIEKATKIQKRSNYFEKDEPFWGARGRRDSLSTEDYDEYLDYANNCKNCFGTVHYDTAERNYKDRRDESLAPFWGARGRRNSDELDENEPFWGNRGRRQEDEPFWGTRGRRQDAPFWGARGRREDKPFWGNQGRRNDEEPFWGNRGRREDEPFWGNRGRRQDSEPFWGTRGRRETQSFWENRGRRKADLKQSILNAMNAVKNDIEHLSRLRRSGPSSFWSNRGRNSKLKDMFNSARVSNIYVPQKIGREYNAELKTDPRTMTDSRIFAEEPHYIVVERSSRSSGESEDPFYISRGKKYYLDYDLLKAARDRRGAIEEIVKTVRNDPYYIARGKKDTDGAKNQMNTTNDEEFAKVKELICSAVDMVALQNNGKVKREIDNDRDRRSALKKLAAQLQIDPYYVSRGKKSDPNKANLLEFITEIAEKCE